MSSLIGSSNTDYHANTTHLSSSQLKLLLRSPEEFYNKYVARIVPKESKSHFDEGTFVHSLLLEPDKIQSQFAVFNGLRKAGASYEQFAANNLGKIVLSLPQVSRCEGWAKAALTVPLVNEILDGCLKEETMVSNILGVPVKARADALHPIKRYLVDVKTTSMETDVDLFKGSMVDYAYDLSAALYCQIAHDTYGELFDFYFIVISKADNGVAVYKCSSETLSAGAAKFTSALVLYKKCTATNNWSSNRSGTEFASHNIEILEV